MSDLPQKRKRTINPRLLDDDNVSIDAIKRRKAASKSATQTTQASNSSNNPLPMQVMQQTPSASRRASVEAVDDNAEVCLNAGSPKNGDTILESVDDDDDDNGIDISQLKGKDAERTESKDTDTEDEPEETDEDELSKLRSIPLLSVMLINLPLERLQKDWCSKVYAFFQSKVNIAYIDGRKCHEFTCSAKNCKAKGNKPRIVRRYLDTKDRASTKSLRAHAIKCWG